MELKINFTKENLDFISGKTLEERAKLVLGTLGRTSSEIKKAYRIKAREYHPDCQGDEENFKLVLEAYRLLIDKKYPKQQETSLLADDDLVQDFLERQIEALDFIKKQREWEEYMKKHMHQYYGVGVI